MFQINHFTMANIYMGMGNLEKAKQFYMVRFLTIPWTQNQHYYKVNVFQSTLSLQSTFEPAVERLMAIMCGRK